MKNGLYIVATPIGNLGDITERAISTLKEADIIACEDTRITKKLFSLLGLPIKKTFVSLHNFNEEEKSQEVINKITEGNSVALVSDAGSPLISDPGYKLVKKCREQNVYLTTIPGVSAIISALQLSGLPTNRFMFAGFIPNKDKARKDLFNELKSVPSTLVFYETAPRILKTLIATQEVLGKREVAAVREITKMYEETITGLIEDVISQITHKEIKGEIVFIIAPPTEKQEPIDLEKIIKTKLKTLSLKDAVTEICQQYKQPKNKVYEQALKIKNQK